MIKVKNACPFCGCLSIQILEPLKDSDNRGFQVECVNCGSRGPCGMISSDEACLAWENGDASYKRPFLENDSWTSIKKSKMLLPDLPLEHCDFSFYLSCQFCENCNIYSNGIKSIKNMPYTIYAIEQSCEYCGSSWDLCFESGRGSTYVYLNNVQGLKTTYTGLIYFIEALGSLRIKIGFSRNPKQRLKNLQTGCPYPLRILATMQGDESTEKEIHTRFDEYRLDGEWFHACKDLLGYINGLPNKINE